MGAIPRLQWRHSGLGMLQAYVLEGGQQEFRVHIWHPSLKLEGIDEAGLGHDHRFDMTSWVLVGQLTHVEILTSADATGGWKMYEVVNARKALKETGTRAGEFRLIDGVVRLDKHAISISAGSAYFFPKRSFHETCPDSQVVVTVALKINQDEVPARILCRLGREPLNAFETSLSETQYKVVLAEAEAALHDAISSDPFVFEAESITDRSDSTQSSCELLNDSLYELSHHDLNGVRSPLRGCGSSEEARSD
jgi:hypothetical protein